MREPGRPRSGSRRPGKARRSDVGSEDRARYLFDLVSRGLDPLRVDWQGFYENWIDAEHAQLAEDPAPYVTARDRFAYAYGGRMVQRVWGTTGQAGVRRLHEHPFQTTQGVMSGSSDTLEAERENVRSRGIPSLSSTGELIGVTTLGEFPFDECYKRLGFKRAGTPAPPAIRSSLPTCSRCSSIPAIA